MRALSLTWPLLALGCADLVGADFDQARRASPTAGSGGASSMIEAGAGTPSSGAAGVASAGAPNDGSAGMAGQDPGLPLEVTVTLPPNPMDATGTGAGTVLSTDGAIDCGEHCRASYQGAAPELVAHPADGSAFHSWISDPPGACGSDPLAPTCVLAAGAQINQNVQAYFVSGGTNLWAAQFGGQGYSDARALAFDPADNLYVCGNIADPASGSLDVTEGAVQLAKYDGFGHLLHRLTFGGLAKLSREELAVTAHGELATTGEYDESITLDPIGSLSYDGQGHDAYIAELNSDFSPRWLKAVNGYGNQSAGPVLISPLDGSVFAAFAFDDTINSFGDPDDPLSNPGDTAIALFKFNPADGSLAWRTSFGSGGELTVADHGLALSTANGETPTMIVAGDFATRLDDGGLSFDTRGGVCPPLFSQDNRTAYVVGLDLGGRCLFATQFGRDQGFSSATSVAVLPDGDLVLGGVFSGLLDFDPVGESRAAQLSTSDADLQQTFIVRLSDHGTWVPGRSFAFGIGEANGTRNLEQLRQLAVDKDANIVLALTFFGSAQVGPVSYSARGQTGESDILLVKLDQYGTLVYSHAFGTAQTDDLFGVACDSSGACAVGGTHGTNVNSLVDRLDFGGIASNPLPAPSPWSGFIAKFSP